MRKLLGMDGSDTVCCVCRHGRAFLKTEAFTLSSMSESLSYGPTKTVSHKKMAVFWVVAPCSLVVVYQRFRCPCCLHHHKSTPLSLMAVSSVVPSIMRCSGDGDYSLVYMHPESDSEVWRCIPRYWKDFTICRLVPAW
jgi:hypothetical protein